MPLSYSIITRLQHQHETVSELIKGLSEANLKQVVNPGKWSAFENIAHLTAYQPTFLQRMHLIEQKDNPLFERYVAESDPVFNDCRKHSLKDLLEDLSTQRFILHKHITQLNETTLRRTGIHPKFGIMTINQWADFFLLHEAHHLFTLFMLTAEQRKLLHQ
jgi:DinB superfamily